MKISIRKWAIKQGLITPTLKEAQSIFKFPVKLTASPKTIGLGSHIKRVL